MANLNKRLKNLGIVSIMDLDDYWSPGPHHPAYHLIKQAELDIKILNNIKTAENVTTTTPIFAKEITKFNKSVFVLPNAIDQLEPQFTPNLEPNKSGRLRIGWIGGSSHRHDLEILNGVVGKLKSANLLDKVQFVLCGFDTRGSHTEIVRVVDSVTKQPVIDPLTGKQREEQKVRNILPTESVWFQYEKIFTDNYSSVSPEYKDYLMKFKKEDYPDVHNEAYRRVWTKHISSYATNYNLFDVSLAPLEENIFNSMKSELKVIEASFHNKAIIAQNYGPYQIGLKNALLFGGGFDANANAILIDKDKNHKDWYSAIKKLIENPDMVKTLQTNLTKTIKPVYSIDKVTSDRRDLYLKLLNEKN